MKTHGNRRHNFRRGSVAGAPKSARALRGLTLVEMLVVLGIVATLAALITPAILRARENARSVSCANNLKSLGGAFTNCVLESNGALPSVYYNLTGSNGQYQVTLKTLGTDQPDALFNNVDPRTLNCNDDKHPTTVLGRTQTGTPAATPTSFAYNVSLPLMYRNLSRVAGPANTAAFYEGNAQSAVGAWQYSNGWADSSVVSRHHGEANYLYLDGHVESAAVVPELAFSGGGKWTPSAMNSNPVSVAMSSSAPQSADYIVNASADPNGVIDPSGPVSVASGAYQAFVITPSAGYAIADVRVDGASIGARVSYVFTGVTANHGIAASFVRVFTLAAVAGPSWNGTISPAGTVTVNVGASMSYAITPAAGYQIDDVQVDGVSVGPVTSYTFTSIAANHTITATADKLGTITATAGANGSISPAGATTVAWKGNQSYTIAPNAGYGVADVLVDGASIGPATSYSFTNVTANHSIAATFAKDYTITATAGPSWHGTISPSGTVTLLAGASQTYTMTAAAGYQIDDVQVDGVSVGPVTSYTFTSTAANHTITATADKLGTITATAGANGSISPAGATTVPWKANQSYSITPNTGYQIDDVQVDGVSVGPVASYTFTRVAADHTIAATTHKPGTITATAGANGSISPTGATTVAWKGNQSYTITPKAGYGIADVQVDGASVGPVTSYSFTSVTADHSIAASFGLNYTITASGGPSWHGTISPSGAVTVVGGTSQTFTMTPAAGYGIDDVQVDGVSVGPVATYTFTSVAANHTIQATAHQAGTITATAGANGSISPAGATIVPWKQDQSYTITPANGYKVSDVLVDGASVGAVTSYTFTSVKKDHTIQASFSHNGK